MPWFVCNDCGDTIKKPKVPAHSYSCGRSGYACVDCGRHFDGHSVKAHNTCVTEHDKYAKGATKPGGHAARGYFGEGEHGNAAAAPAGDTPAPTGLEFLATRPPWACSACGVTCTSRETLLGHAAGAKHRRRAAAAARAAAGEGGEDKGGEDQAAPSTPAAVAPAVETTAAPTPEKKNKTKKEPKWKKLGVAALQKAPKSRLKISALQAAVLEAAGLPAGDAGAAAAALKAWSGSSKFSVEGGKVGLAKAK